MTYAAPGALWLLAVPLALALLWAWQAVRRWRDARALRAARTVPWRERHGRLGVLPAWLFLVAAAACLLGAVARPRGTAAAIGRAGVDIVVLADASASMHVQDVAGGRWHAR